MAVLKKVRHDNYTTICNDVFHDNRLSLKALGLFCRMMSLPPDWSYSLSGLAALSRDKIDSVRSAVNELRDLGYLEVKRLHDSNGLFIGVDYIIYESLDLKEPLLEKPILEKPILEKPTLLNTNNINNLLYKSKSRKFNDFEQRAAEFDYSKLIEN